MHYLISSFKSFILSLSKCISNNMTYIFQYYQYSGIFANTMTLLIVFVF